MNILLPIIGWAIALGIAIVVIVSIVLFMKDGMASKKDGRSRNKKITVMFIISMVITGLSIVIGILLMILAMLAIRSM